MKLIETTEEETWTPSTGIHTTRLMAKEISPQDDGWVPHPEQDQSLWDMALNARERVIESHRNFWRQGL